MEVVLPQEFWAKTIVGDKPGISVRDHCSNVGGVAQVMFHLLPKPLQDLLPPGVITLAALHDVAKLLAVHSTRSRTAADDSLLFPLIGFSSTLDLAQATAHILHRHRQTRLVLFDRLPEQCVQRSARTRILLHLPIPHLILPAVEPFREPSSVSLLPRK